MANVKMEELVRVQTVGPEGIGVFPPIPVEEISKVSDAGLEMAQVQRSANVLPHPGAVEDGSVMKEENDVWTGGEGGGGGSADIDLGVTDASVGDYLKVKTVDEDGKPTAWESEPVDTETIIEETDAWLEDNIAQETGYVLDRTLTMSNAAAPADLVGAQSEAIDEITVPKLTKLSDTIITGKYISGTGAVTDASSGASQWEVTDYVDVSGLSKVAITASSYTSRMYYAFYDSNKAYIANSGKAYVSGTVLRDEIVNVPATAKYCVAMWYYTTSANDPIIKGVGLKPDPTGLVEYDNTQTLTDEQKAQARQNIGAASDEVNTVLNDHLKLTTSFTSGFFVNQSSGSIVGDSRYSASAFVYIKSFSTITFPMYFTGANAGMCLYDRNFNKVRSVVNSGSSGAEQTLSIQQNEYYARFSCLTANVSSFYLKVDNGIANAIKNVGETIENDRTDDTLFSKIIHDGGFIRIFNTIGVIGDSLASGEMAYGNASDESTTEYVDMFQYSWIQYIARECGTTAYNFSQGGLSTRNFLTDLGGWLTKLQNPDYKCQAYFIALGHNDASNSTVPIGTTSDINLSDPTQNADTYYGNYARIISIIKTVQPNAKIFCVCMKSSGYASYNTAIRYMATIYTNVYILDFETYYPNLESTWEYTQGHGNAMGYLNYSWQIGTYVDWIIRNNRSDFKYVQFIGTDYDQYIPT